MPSPQAATTTLALFCKVVDNYGDIGICWRLARQLHKEHQIDVQLWVDDLISFQRICPEVATNREAQILDGIRIQYWQNQDASFTPAEIADIVIEFFACDIPPGYIASMAQCERPPVWINLEGLSAEEWVEGCHTLPSPHPSFSLTKYFFFPGFNAKTGGLIHERTLDQERRDFLTNQPNSLQTKAQFFEQLGVLPAEISSLKVSLFCYPHAPVAALFATWSSQEKPILCLVPDGVATEAIQNFLGETPTVGHHYSRGPLTVRIIPFMPQADYDKLLWSCDLNFVRGEDSFVRAQWAAKAFIWHIYPQDENLHHKKLNAFLQTHLATTHSSKALSLAWNEVHTDINWQDLWSNMSKDLATIEIQSQGWLEQMNAIGDLASNLLSFVNTKR